MATSMAYKHMLALESPSLALINVRFNFSSLHFSHS
jgi:hypothetical protein